MWCVSPPMSASYDYLSLFSHFTILGAVRKYRCFFRDDIGASGGGGGLSHVRLFEHQKNIDLKCRRSLHADV